MVDKLKAEYQHLNRVYLPGFTKFLRNWPPKITELVNELHQNLVDSPESNYTNYIDSMVWRVKDKDGYRRAVLHILLGFSSNYGLDRFHQKDQLLFAKHFPIGFVDSLEYSLRVPVVPSTKKKRHLISTAALKEAAKRVKGMPRVARQYRANVVLLRQIGWELQP